MGIIEIEMLFPLTSFSLKVKKIVVFWRECARRKSIYYAPEV